MGTGQCSRPLSSARCQAIFVSIPAMSVLQNTLSLNLVSAGIFPLSFQSTQVVTAVPEDTEAQSLHSLGGNFFFQPGGDFPG